MTVTAKKWASPPVPKTSGNFSFHGKRKVTKRKAESRAPDCIRGLIVLFFAKQYAAKPGFARNFARECTMYPTEQNYVSKARD